MKYLLLIYTDDSLMDALPASEFDTRMRGCLEHADELRANGALHDSQQLEPPAMAKTLRERDGRSSIVDGPFAETKEMLAGFNLIEAESFDEAVRIAAEFPWASTGAIEIRPVRDLDDVRERVGARRAQR
ncbi:MAG: YciI family protein [Dokdonella sp.]